MRLHVSRCCLRVEFGFLIVLFCCWYWYVTTSTRKRSVSQPKSLLQTNDETDAVIENRAISLTGRELTPNLVKDMNWPDPALGNQSKYLCYNALDRQGNQMFGFASAFSLARSKGMKLVLCQSFLHKIFNLTSNAEEQQLLGRTVCKKAKLETEGNHLCQRFDKRLAALDGSENILLRGCLRSWKYFEGSVQQIRREFTFHKNIQNVAVDAFHLALRKRGIEVPAPERVFVGIHVRRGDRISLKQYVVPKMSYYSRAMTFFVTKYDHVTFVVCSEDMPWVRRNFPEHNVVLVETGRPETDMAVLTQCNHTIQSVGTFSWWAAWLVNGTSVYHATQFTPDSKEDRQTNMTDFYLPTWIPME